MKKPDFTRACPIDRAEMPHGGDRQSLVSGDRAGREEKTVAPSETFVEGVIVDSWVEPAQTADAGARLILQVACREYPDVLVIVDARASLVCDRGGLEDLSENLCHGIPVLALGTRSFNELFVATWLQLTR